MLEGMDVRGRLDAVAAPLDVVVARLDVTLAEMDVLVVLVTQKKMLADTNMRVAQAMLADMDMEMEMTASQLSAVGVLQQIRREVEKARMPLANSGWRRRKFNSNN